MTAERSLSIAAALQLATQTTHLPLPEVQILLAHLLQRPRSHLYAWPEQALSDRQWRDFLALIERRKQGEPAAYLTGQREFWSLPLRVTPDTLIPRPETELLVECALSLLEDRETASVADLGTGSGAIAAAIASERPGLRLIATDISAAALAVAETNFQTLGFNHIEIRQGAWLAPLKHGERYDLILSNPPYIAEDDPHLRQEGLPGEPQAALTAGPDGLRDIRELIEQAPGRLQAEGWLLLEHGAEQGTAVRQLFSRAGYREISTHLDLGHRERLTKGKRPVDDGDNFD